MKTMTQRKQYARPQMTVVELRHQCYILAGSGGAQEPQGTPLPTQRRGKPAAGHSPPM